MTMNENNKSFMYGCVVGVLVGFLLCCTMQGRNDTDRTLSKIKEQQHGVGTEIGNARDSVKQSKDTLGGVSNTISRVQGRLDTSQRIASDNAREIERLAEIARECRSLAEENRVILNDVRKTDSDVKGKR